MMKMANNNKFKKMIRILCNPINLFMKSNQFLNNNNNTFNNNHNYQLKTNMTKI